MDDGWGLRCVMYVFYTNKYLRIDSVNGCSRGLGGRRLLRYDISELWETGGGAEMWLQKLQNGIGVFHYVG